MVFCGRPSGSCHACRARKTRCDKVPEGCTQCKKAKRICPGYRVIGDLVFRDEGPSVVKKQKAKEARMKTNSPFVHQSSPSISDQDQENISSPESMLEIVRQNQTPLSLSYSLAPNLEERATTLFAFNYVLDENGPSLGHFNKITDFVRTQTLDETVLTAMKAVGLAIYSHSARAPTLLNNSRYQYTKAIQLTNAALRDQEDVIKDSTLMAIQILGVYEQVTGCRQESLKDWIEHIYGASAVIKMRGKQQVQTTAGRRMLVQVTSNLLIRAVYGSIRLPAHVREYMLEAQELIDIYGEGFGVQGVMILFADLRADIKEGKLKGPSAILARATELDEMLTGKTKNIPLGWTYDTVHTDEESDIIYNGTYHVYYDSWVALKWNALRTVRICINELIRGSLLTGFSAIPAMFTEIKYTTQFQQATETLLALQADILYSVPQNIGRGSPPRSMANEIDRIGNFKRIPMAGASFLMWPLWLAAVMDLRTPAIQEYAARVLRSIGNVQGIRQAHVLADLVENDAEISVWDVKAQKLAL